jgi:hypothetical protein
LQQGTELVELAERTVSVSNLPELDYWEVDPAWDGITFRSAAQAIRPVRSGEICRELPLPFKRENQPVCVRLVTIQGEQVQVVLD